jgi:hypothetical protein
MSMNAIPNAAATARQAYFFNVPPQESFSAGVWSFSFADARAPEPCDGRLADLSVTWDRDDMSAPRRPSRYVAADHHGWMPTRGPDGRYTYTIMHEEYLTEAELVERHGPLRPVVPLSKADVDALGAAFERAGRKAAYSVAVAVLRTIERCRDDAGGMDRPDESHESSLRQIRAGRPRSWEAHRLTEMASWSDVEMTSRYDEPATQAIHEILYRWVTDPDGYVEVAENLAAITSRWADEHGGWQAFADQWLQPGALDKEGVFLTYSLLYSLSEHFDYDVLSYA